MREYVRKYMRKKGMLIFVLVIMLLSIACANEQPVDDGQMLTIYEVNKEETKVAGRLYDQGDGVGDILIERLMDELSTTSPIAEMRPAIAPGVTLNGYQLFDETITIDFDADYYKQSITGEVLSRAAIVRTLTQLDEIQYVQFTVNGTPLVNRSGAPVGIMTASQFIDNSGKEINTQEQVSLTLYFADLDGEKLKKVNRKVVYSSNISLDKLVIEQLISGVTEEEEESLEAYSTINPETKTHSVMVSDGVCYVNFDSTFLSQVYDNSAEVTIYSIVNSLVELPDINKVQIMINGNSELFYKETMPLSQMYERNLEIVRD